MANSVHKYW